jgi:hypothetical protein
MNAKSKIMEPETTVDAHIENHGTIFLVRPVSSMACDWITANVSEDSQYFGSALVVEHRYIGDLFRGMVDAGLVVR